jgi:hypothetical protein
MRWLATLSLVVVSFLVLPPQVAHADPAGVTVQRYYCIWENEWTTTSTSYVDIEPSTGYKPLNLTFTPPVTANYLLIVCFTVSNSDTSGTTSAQLLQNDTQIYLREWTPTSTLDYVTSGYTNVLPLTGGTPYTFKIQLKTSAHTAKIRDTSIILFKITNYYSAIDDNTYTFTTSTYVDGLSLSIPSPASGDYLVLTSTSVSSSSTDKRLYCNWLRGSTSQAEIVREFKTANQRRGWLMMRIMTFTSTAETLKLQFKVETTSTCSVYKQRIVAVKLSDLGINSSYTESEGESTTTSTSWVNKATKTFTPSPAQPGDYLVMGFAMLNGDSTDSGHEAYARLTIDNTVYQAERNFRPDDTLDYVPLYAFKKYRMLSGSHTINIDYRSSDTHGTTIVKIENARILVIKVNTLQSYEDSAVTTRTVFDGSHHTINIYGYAYEYQWSIVPPAPMPYKVVYYDGGTSHDGVNGAKVFTDSVNSNYNRSIYSTLDFRSYPSSSYGTWHAVIYRAYSGDPAEASTYTANDSNSIMEIQFTVQQDAIYNTPPSMTYVKLYNSGGSAEVTAMTPQTAYDVKVKVADADGKADLTTIVVKLWYDADGSTPTEGEFTAAAANTQTCAIITWTESGGTFAIQPAASTTWALGSCIAPADLTGDFEFKFTVGKVATETTGSANWQIAAKVTDDSSQTAFGYDTDTATNDMNWYGEIAVTTTNVDFSSVALGSDFSANKRTGISVTYRCNGSYSQQVKSSSPWSGGGKAVTLNTAGTPGSGEFSLKAYSSDTYGSAVPVNSTGYVTIGTGTQTGESGTTVSANTLWLKLGAAGIPAVSYSGTIYYGITQ